MTWMCLCTSWVYLLCLHMSRPTSIPTQWWCDILYGPTGRDHDTSSTLNAQCAQSLKHVFGNVFGEMNGLVDGKDYPAFALSNVSD